MFELYLQISSHEQQEHEQVVRSERLSLSLGTSEAANDLTESKASRPFRGGRTLQKATVVCFVGGS